LLQVSAPLIRYTKASSALPDAPSCSGHVGPPPFSLCVRTASTYFWYALRRNLALSSKSARCSDSRCRSEHRLCSRLVASLKSCFDLILTSCGLGYSYERRQER